MGRYATGTLEKSLLVSQRRQPAPESHFLFKAGERVLYCIKRREVVRHEQIPGCGLEARLYRFMLRRTIPLCPLFV